MKLLYLGLFCAHCMHVCMYACMHACMYVCMYVYMYVCMYVCMYVSIYYVCNEIIVFRPLLCTLLRLNWAKQTPGIMRRN